MQHIKDQALATSTMTEKIVRYHRTREQDEILNWLTPVEYGPEQSDYIAKRQPKTGDWLLESTEFQHWLGNGNQTLFCPGIPGAGKTILTAAVVDNLQTLCQDDRTVGVAYVYCNFRRQDQQTAKDLLASVLKQLARGVPTFPDGLESLHHKHKCKRSRPSVEEIASALGHVAASYARIFIVVDGLDECRGTDNHRRRFLSELFNLQRVQTLQAGSGINLFATSRPLPEITSIFHGTMTQEIRATQSDVWKYLDGHMGGLRSFVQENTLLQQEIKTEISDAVNGM